MTKHFPNRERARALLGHRPRLERAKAILASVQPGSISLQIAGPIDEELADYVANKLAAAPTAKRLDVFVQSDGGDIESGFAIFDGIVAHGATEKIAHGIGAVHSAAVFPFIACNVRKLYDGATLLLHGASLEPSSAERWTAKEYAKRGDRLKTLDKGIAATIAERAGCATASIEREMANEAFTSHARAKALRIATHTL